MAILAIIELLVGLVYLVMARQDQPPRWVPKAQRWAARGRNALIIGLVLEGLGGATLILRLLGLW